MNDGFDELFVEKDELNEEILKSLLTGRIKMTETGDIIFQKEFDPKKAIILHLLANKIFVMRKIKSQEAEGPKDIHLKTGVAEGTVKGYVRSLEKERLLVRTNGKYFVPNHALNKIKTVFDEK